jgi:curli production assembly/transport component CsgF
MGKNGVGVGKTGVSKTGFRIRCVAGGLGLLALLTPAFATEQVYHPISPILGGNPANGPFLLSTAQAQGEGVNSGNNGPTINFPPVPTPTTPTGSGNNGNSGANGNNGGATSNATFRNNSLANPLGTSSGRF